MTLRSLRSVASIGAVCVALLVFTAPALAGDGGGAEPVLHIEGGSAVEALPDLDGQARLRVRNDIHLQLKLHPRWRIFAAGNLRFGRSLAGDAPTDTDTTWAGQGLDEADLYRLGLRYSTPDLSLTLGRFVRPAFGGLYRVDGAGIEVGSTNLPVGLDAWVGRVGHPEPLTPVSAFGAGVEGRIYPRGPEGGWSGVAIRVGYDLHKSVPGMRHRWYGGVSARSGAGHSIAGGAEFGLLPAKEGSEEEDDLGLRAWFNGTLIPTSTVRIIGSFRWDDLPPPGIPETSVSAIETLLPRGYAIGKVAVELRPGPLSVRIGGGPTLLPSADGAPRIGATAKASAEVPLDHGRVGFFAAATAVGTSSYMGGGGGLSGYLGPLHLGGDVGAYRFAGLDGQLALIAEGRFNAELTLPLPAHAGPVAGDLRIAAHVAGGADRLLAPWIRTGLSLRGTLDVHRGRSR